MSQISKSRNAEQVKTDRNEAVSPNKTVVAKSRFKSKDSDTIFYEQQTETEQPISEYERERLKYIQVRIYLY